MATVLADIEHFPSSQKVLLDSAIPDHAFSKGSERRRKKKGEPWEI